MDEVYFFALVFSAADLFSLEAAENYKNFKGNSDVIIGKQGLNRPSFVHLLTHFSIGTA